LQIKRYNVKLATLTALQNKLEFFSIAIFIIIIIFINYISTNI